MEKIKAQERNLPEAYGMPDEIELYEETATQLILPRGFASQLVVGLESHHVEIAWQDERCRTSGFDGGQEIPARPYQQKVIDAILDVEQGIITAPTGSGKTVAALDVVQKRGGNALVIVNTKEIADQWIKRCGDWLGEDYPVGLIGDGSFEITDGLTVAIQATLWSRRDTLLAEGFFDRFQTVCLDECHHSTARTYNFVMNEFSAECRFGMSATPKKTGDFRLAQNIIGPIIVEVTEKDVEEQVLPAEIHVIQTTFGAVYKGDKMTDHGFRRNNYQTILKKLSGDKTRAQLVVDTIMGRCQDNVNLVLSKRLDHLALLWDTLVASGYDKDDIVTIVGMDSRDERREAIERTERGPCVILSTLADEALDAPRIDRVHLTWPTRNTDLVQQQIGRGRRRHPDKEDCVVFDYRDFQVGPLEKQYMDRRHKLYNPKGWKVKKIK